MIVDYGRLAGTLTLCPATSSLASRQKSAAIAAVGCSIGAKQSVDKNVDSGRAKVTALALITETRAQKIRIEAGHVTGVEASSNKWSSTYDTLQIRGRRCRRHPYTRGSAPFWPSQQTYRRNTCICIPVSNVNGVFDEEIRPWEGTMQAIYSDEHRFMAGNFGVKYETTAMQPVIAMAALPWRNLRSIVHFYSSFQVP